MSQRTQPHSPSHGQSGQSKPSAGERLKKDASDAAEQVKQRASDLSDQAKSEATKAKAFGDKKVRQATESVKATSRDYAKQKKSQAACEVGVFRDAVQKAADKLSEENHVGVASYVSAAAEQLDRLRESIEERNVGDLLGEAHRVARKHPEIVCGGMFVAGLALMRFLKASNGADADADADVDKHRVGSTRPVQMQRGQRLPRDPGVPRDSRLSGRQPPRTSIVSSDTVVTNPNITA